MAVSNSVSFRTETGAMSMKPVGHDVSAAFGAATLGTTMFVVVPQVLLLFYMTETLAVTPALAALAIMAPKVVEVFFDPAIGRASDRTRSRLGARLPYMLIGGALFPLAFACLFFAPQALSGVSAALYVGVIFLICTLLYSLFSVPYVALYGEIANDASDRRRMVAWRMAFMALGVLAAGALAPAIVTASGGGRGGYASMSMVAGAVCFTMFAFAIAAIWRRARGQNQVSEPASLGATLKGLLRARSYRRLWLAYVLQLVCVSLNAAMLPYAAKYLLGSDETLIAVIFVLLTGVSLAATPLWVMAGARVGDRTAYILAASLYAVATAAFWFSDAMNGAGVLVAAALLGFAQGGQQIFPFSLLPQVIAESGAAAQSAGFMTGFWISGEKLALALGAALAGAGLAASGFIEGAAEAQSAQVLEAIRWMFSIVPAALCLVSLVFLFRQPPETA